MNTVTFLGQNRHSAPKSAAILTMIVNKDNTIDRQQQEMLLEMMGSIEGENPYDMHRNLVLVATWLNTCHA